MYPITQPSFAVKERIQETPCDSSAAQTEAFMCAVAQAAGLDSNPSAFSYGLRR